MDRSEKQAWEQTKTANGSLYIEDVERTISANEDRLQAAFENLFRNAVEHGGTDVDIRIGTFNDGLYVADSGPGIPPEKQAEVFKYGHSDSGETGLGLASVRDVMDAHEWHISITEATTGGAMFEIENVKFNPIDKQISK